MTKDVRWKRWIRKTSSLVPVHLKDSLKAALSLLSMESSLTRMKRNGFEPHVVIDVGAYSGDWTRLCKELFPSAAVLLVEPLQAKTKDLEHLAAGFSGVRYERTLLGSSERSEVPFYEKETASSVLHEVHRDDQPSSYLPMTTLDNLVHGSDFASPNLMKLDVQGYELDVLRGAEHAIETVEAIVTEVNLIAIHQGAALAHELVGYMADRDFVLYDIATFYRRPYDDALWQIDADFVRTSSGLVTSTRWD
jgi:FkbM family methyltransferase